MSEEDKNILDETEQDSSVTPVQYNISSYGADYDVEGLVRRLNRGDIYIPPFQRDYVWTIREASRFVESLLLGLPVPGIFLARDPMTNRLLVIDGQQRLKSLQFFMSGFFNPQPESKSKRVFKLNKVQSQFDGSTYEDLSDDNRRFLDDSIIHATIVKQEKPKDDDTSIYHIFERLNNSGRKLTPQQIRVAIYNGEFIDLIKKLNEHENWRDIYGRISPTLKDQELILRFLALYFASNEYRRPMREYLNLFTMWGRKQDESVFETCEMVFKNTIDLALEALGPRAFRPERALNAAVFDSMMVGIAHRLDKGGVVDPEKLRIAYDEIISNYDYLEVISQSTSDEKNVAARLEMVKSKFAEL